jgi:hypothetical protein
MKLETGVAALIPDLLAACAGGSPRSSDPGAGLFQVEFRCEKLADNLFVLFGGVFDERWGKGLFSPDAAEQRVCIGLNRSRGPGEGITSADTSI